MQLDTQGEYLLIVSEKGLGKCTYTKEFTVQNRGGKGVKCYKITEKSGNVIGVISVGGEDEVMLITTEGIIIRIQVSDTALLGRITSGVKLINLKDDVTVASIAKVVEDKSLIPPETEENSAETASTESTEETPVETSIEKTEDHSLDKLIERAEEQAEEENNSTQEEN